MCALAFERDRKWKWMATICLDGADAQKHFFVLKVFGLISAILCLQKLNHPKCVHGLQNKELTTRPTDVGAKNFIALNPCSRLTSKRQN
jgi:hypothetical protein